jgi:TRAP-type C4-dicarboxylate transport system permease small subunit
VQRAGRLLDRGVDGALHLLKWLVLPISFLLFLQWPLREYFQAYSREANDLGQWLFALYIAAGVTAATRAGTHLATDAFARRYGPRTRRWLSRFCNLLALAPWAIFVLVSAGPMIVASVSHVERFPETGNPGYFVVRFALWLLAGLILVTIVSDMAKRDESDR